MTSLTDAIDAPDVVPPAPQEPDKPGRVRGIAVAGEPLNLTAPPPPPEWPVGTPYEEYVPDTEFDVLDLTLVNSEINRARVRLFECSHALWAQQRWVHACEVEYSRAMRRALVSVSGGTAEIRKAVAEMQCEPLENNLVVARQVAEELRKRCQDMRDDLRTLENVGHNVRAQMDVR